MSETGGSNESNCHSQNDGGYTKIEKNRGNEIRTTGWRAARGTCDSGSRGDSVRFGARNDLTSHRAALGR